MTNPHRTRLEILVCIDWDQKDLGTESVTRFLGDALVSHETDMMPHWKTGEPLVRHRFVFDATMVRNTEAHGAGYRAGFVSHVE